MSMPRFDFSKFLGWFQLKKLKPAPTHQTSSKPVEIPIGAGPLKMFDVNCSLTLPLQKGFQIKIGQPVILVASNQSLEASVSKVDSTSGYFTVQKLAQETAAAIH